jgi:hypothetical protein
MRLWRGFLEEKMGVVDGLREDVDCMMERERRDQEAGRMVKGWWVKWGTD